MEAPKLPLVGFYFFPHPSYDQGRADRYHRLGRDDRYPPSDIELAARKPALGWLQPDYKPKIHSINLATPQTNWDDLNPQDIASQLRTLETVGADFIALDCYAGYYEGKPYIEYAETAKIIASEIRNTGLKFYTNMCLKLPRAILPVNQPNYQEPFRDFDLSLDTFNYMLDFSAALWNNPNYLRVDEGRPVLGIYGLTAEKTYLMFKSFPTDSFPLVRWLKTRNRNRSYLPPFVIGVADTFLMAPDLEQSGFDMITTMCGLPNFTQNTLLPAKAMDLMPTIEQVQEYSPLLTLRMTEAYILAHTIKGIEHPCHFIPSLTLGWDPRPRAVEIMPAFPQGSTSPRGYPFSPVIEGPNIDELMAAFKHMRIYLSTIAHTLIWPYKYEQQPIVPVFAANEMGDGACVYPRVIDGKIDRSRFDAIAQMITLLKAMKI